MTATVGLSLSAPAWVHAETDNAASTSDEEVSVLDTVNVNAEAENPDPQGTSTADFYGGLTEQEAPFSIGTYDEKLIENQRAFTLAEVLRNDPSVAPLGGGSTNFYNREDFTIRGFAADNFNSYRIDGMPYVHMVEPALDDIQRIEVLKGPAALRFGAMGPGGAINMVRKRPTESPTASIQFDLNSDSMLYTQLDTGGRLGPDNAVGYRVVLASDQYESFYDDSEGYRKFYSGFFDWRLNNAATLWVSISNNESERGAFSGALVAPDGTVFGDPEDNYLPSWAKNWISMESLAFGADMGLNDNWSLHYSSAFNESVRVVDSAWIYPVNNDGSFTSFQGLRGPYSWEVTNHQLFTEGRFDTGGIRHNVVIGASYVETKSFMTGSDWSALGPNSVYDEIDYGKITPNFPPKYLGWVGEEYGLFVTDTLTLSERWKALVGARLIRITSESFGQDGLTVGEKYDERAVAPTAALMFEPMDGLNTYISYATGLTQGGTAPNDPLLSNPNENQPPIESQQLELGLKYNALGGRLYTEVALFQIELDLEYLIPNVAYVQDGSQVHTGIEFSTTYAVTSDMDLGVAAMILDAEQEETGDATLDGKTPANVAEYQANLWGEYRLQSVPGLAFNVSALFVDDTYGDNVEGYTIDGYAVIDAGASYRFQPAAGGTWTTRLYVENLTNKEYFEGGYQSATGGALYYGEPLTVTASLAIEY
ncbi:MAG: TonB-dependent siderophore receptor [Pseudomonadota bacterium]|nr:TonB-dependent siderophore receptor [Pseudomonadota bacterium]